MGAGVGGLESADYADFADLNFCCVGHARGNAQSAGDGEGADGRW
jgi:hypothetical protein